VGVSEPPNEMFGKLMSISDDLMDRYYLLLLTETRDASMHPMEAKKQLAARITTRFHSEQEAVAARSDWETRFSKKDLAAADLPEVAAGSLAACNSNVAVVSELFRIGFGIEKSNNEIRRHSIQTGAYQINGEKITDPAGPRLPAPEDVVRLSKKHSVRII